MIKLFLLLLPVVMFAQSVVVKEVRESMTQKNYGYVKIDESNVYDVSPRFNGYVVTLHADKRYKTVKKGQLIATVYSPEVFQAKEEYLNTLHYTKKRKSNGMLESSRLKLKLLGVSDEEINQTKKAKEATENTNIYSPVDGIIFEKSINHGSAFNAKDKLFSIVSLEDVWVEVKILEEQRQNIQKTKNYKINFKGIKNTYFTKEALLYPKLDPKEATLTLRLKVKNPKLELFEGMYANVISEFKTNTYLTLPKTAVIRKNSKFYVFMVSEFKGEFEPREVGVKVLDNNRYIITKGLQKGDEVKNDALFMLDSDTQINQLY